MGSVSYKLKVKSKATESLCAPTFVPNRFHMASSERRQNIRKEKIRRAKIPVGSQKSPVFRSVPGLKPSEY